VAFAIIFLIKKVTGTGVFPFAMMALSADRDTATRESKLYSYPVLTGVKIYDGAIVVLDSSGWAKPAITGTGLVAVGRARAQADNTLGSSGDISVEVEEGVFCYDNSAAADEITKAQIGDVCWLVDDCTVAKTSGTNTRSIAGYIRDLDTDGVWVEFKNTISNDGDLVASLNLGDVANPQTSRQNLGANLVVLEIEVASLIGTGIYRVVSPVAGTITKIKSVIDGALTTGNATLTGKIGVTAITDGVITITQAGSAAGDVDYCAPSALNVVAENNVISVTVGGTNDAARGAKVSILIAT
jgi:hypothetical protein